MTSTDIQAQIEKLNPAQRAALRRKFGGRQITCLNINDDFVTVEFGYRVTHWFFIGPRGAIKHHTFAGK